MGDFTTSCSANGGILNGSMVLDTSTGSATSYTNNNGVTDSTPTNTGNSSTVLNFNVNFPGDPKTYHVNARPDGNGGWTGTGGAPGAAAGVEPWSATAVEPFPKKPEQSEKAL